MMQGKGIPTPLDIKPEIIPQDYEWYVTTYNKIQLSRPIADVYVPLPMTEYVAYFTVYDTLDNLPDDIDVLVSFDKFFVETRNAELEQQRSVNKGKK